MSESLFPAHITNSIAFTLSRDQVLMYGMDDYTPEELVEHNAKMAAFHEQQRQDREQMLEALADLRHMGSLVDVILDLHSCDTEADWSVTCEGCDVDGYEAEQPAWPCRTVLALAAHHGIDMPDKELPGKHYEGEYVPSDGKRWQPPLQRWHTAFSDAMGREIDAAVFHQTEEPK